jgi:hypothetical protein
MAKQEIRKPIIDVAPYKGKYERLDGTRFDVIYAQKEGLQMLTEKHFGNRTPFPVTVDELEKDLKEGKIKKL